MRLLAAVLLGILLSVALSATGDSQRRSPTNLEIVPMAPVRVSLVAKQAPVVSVLLSDATPVPTPISVNLAPVSLTDLAYRVPRPIPIEVLQDGGNLILVGPGLQLGITRGTSMEPLLTEGQTVILKAAQASDVRLADILVWDSTTCLFFAPGLIAHQVVSITGGGPTWQAQTMAWNGRKRDPCTVGPEQVRWIVVLR